MSMDVELLKILERIATALELIAEKPVPGITLEVTPDLMTSQEALEAMK